MTSGYLEFLMSEENLPRVLEIIRHSEEIREKLANQFLGKLQGKIKTSKPKDLNVNFIPQTKICHKKSEVPREIFSGMFADQIFFNIAFQAKDISSNGRGLEYQIEVGITDLPKDDYFCIGLAWLKGKDDYKEFCELKLVRDFLNTLKEKFPNQIERNIEPNPGWLLWKNWDERLRKSDRDLWAWFFEKSNNAFFDDAAAKFWEFVRPTLPFVLKINQIANSPNKIGKI
jgi:hypothetical protein